MSELQPLQQFETIRKHVDVNDEIWYCVVDVIEVLLDQHKKPSRYWYELRRTTKKRSGIELSSLTRKFPIKHKTNGRTYEMDCANQEGVLRIVQSILSPKAEPFKRWLAMTGSRRLDEIKSSEIEAERERLRLLGFSDKEISHRIDGLLKNRELRLEWQKRGVVPNEADRLEDVIHQETFDGLSRDDHHTLKNLGEGDNLTDHLQNMELAFDIMGDLATLTEIGETDPDGYDENRDAAETGGKIAGRLRRKYEEETGRKVISSSSPISERPNKIERNNNNEASGEGK